MNKFKINIKLTLGVDCSGDIHVRACGCVRCECGVLGCDGDANGATSSPNSLMCECVLYI